MAQVYTYGVGYTRLDKALETIGKVIGIGFLLGVGAILGYLLAMRVINYQISHITCHSTQDGSVVCINNEGVSADDNTN